MPQILNIPRKVASPLSVIRLARLMARKLSPSRSCLTSIRHADTRSIAVAPGHRATSGGARTCTHCLLEQGPCGPPKSDLRISPSTSCTSHSHWAERGWHGRREGLGLTRTAVTGPGRESLEEGGGAPLPPKTPALTRPQRHSHTPTPAPTAFATASNRPPPTQPLAHSPVTALRLPWFRPPFPFKQSPGPGLRASTGRPVRQAGAWPVAVVAGDDSGPRTAISRSPPTGRRLSDVCPRPTPSVSHHPPSGTRRKGVHVRLLRLTPEVVRCDLLHGGRLWRGDCAPWPPKGAWGEGGA